MIKEKTINQYINGLIPKESGHLKLIKESSLEDKIPIIDDDVGQILRQLIKIKQVKNILEIGMGTGYSGSLMLDQDEDIKLTTIEIDKERINTAKDNFMAMGLIDRVEILQGDAKEILDTIEGSFDLVFIDGPKSHYKEYFDKSVDLIESRGIIVCDNVLFRGYLLEENPPKRYKTIIKNLREFNRYVMKDERFISSLLPIGDGLIISVKR